MLVRPGSLVTSLVVVLDVGCCDEVEALHIVGELHVCLDELTTGVDVLVGVLPGLMCGAPVRAISCWCRATLTLAD